MMNKFATISNTQLSQLIDDWIKNERDRAIMKRRLIDGITQEKLAEEFDMSPTQIYRITARLTKELYILTCEWVTIN